MKKTNRLQELVVISLTFLIGIWAFYISSMHAYQYNQGNNTGNGIITRVSNHIISSIAEVLNLSNQVTDVLSCAGICGMLIFALFFLGGSVFSIRFLRKESRIADWLGEKNHLLLVGSLFALIVIALQLNGTSVSSWSRWFSSDKSQFPIWGVARSIRSDEYAVWTPLAISQEFTGYAANSPLINGGGETVWVSIGGIPAWNKALIFKPLYWGFPLFGSAYGTSILWTARFFALFFASYGCALLYTRRNQLLSFSAACMISFAPYIQWWYSQSVAEVILFPELMILTLMEFFKTSSTAKKILYAVLFSWLFGCLCMIGYLAWIIPAIYLLVLTTVFLAVKHRACLQKMDFIYLSIPFMAVLFWLLMIVRETWPTLSAVRNSVYPGSRIFTGKNIRVSFYTGLFAPLLQTMQAPVSNPCELSNFISLTPTGLLLTFFNDWKEKKTDGYSVTLICVELLVFAFLWFGLPSTIAKLTLLSYCTRLIMLFGFVDIMLLFRALSRPFRIPFRFGIPLSFVLAGISTYVMSKELTVSSKGVILFVFLLSGLSYTILLTCTRASGENRFVPVYLVLLIILCGGFVNPIQKGLGALTESSVITALREYNDDSDSLYLVEANYPITNVLLTAGKRTFNSVQEYPDMERWKPIDPNGKYVDVYNRFCHISVELTESPTQITVLNPDYIRLDLNKNDISKLGITHLLSKKTYDDSSFIEVLSVDGWNLYQVKAEQEFFP